MSQQREQVEEHLKIIGLHPDREQFYLLKKMLTDQHEKGGSMFEHNTAFANYAPLLRPALGSPFGTVRLAALRLLNQLCAIPSSSTFEPSTILQILLEAEECPADFHNYRQRAQILSRLKISSLEKLLPIGVDKTSEEAILLEKMVLDWLLAQFYERFTLYWPLLAEPIASYAQGMRTDTFWECFEQAMDQTWAKLQKEEKEEEEMVEEKKEEDKDSPLATLPPDYAAFRVQLLRLLTKLPSLTTKSEQRTRYFAPKFIQLYREEFMQFDELVSSFENATEAEDHLEEEEIMIDEEERMKMEDEEGNEEEEEAKPELKMHGKFHRPLNFHTRHRGTMNALKTMLTLFGRFTNPLGVYREREVCDIYYELLLVNEPEVQRLALGCLLTYKHSWLTPYRDSLEGILEEKRLRDQLVLFSVDGQQTAAMGAEKHGRTTGKNGTRAVPLLDEHRADLMPVLLRLLYGSLHTHVAHRGKTKRMAIFRFLANCLPDELALFLSILFGPLISLFEYTSGKNDVVDIEKTLNSLTKGKRPIVGSISLNKLKSIFGTLSDVFHFLGPVLDDTQVHLLFTALLLSGRTILIRDQMAKDEEEEGGNDDADEQTQQEATPLSRHLKNLRLRCMQTFIAFFRAFHFRPSAGSAERINCLFKYFLGPFIAAKGKHKQDNNAEGVEPSSLIVLPTSICRQFCAWAKMPRYHPLLNVPFAIDYSTNSDQNGMIVQATPFSLLCDQLLLTESGGPKLVHLEILRIFSTLLDIAKEGEEEDSDAHQLAFSAILPQADLSATIEDENATFGSRLVLATPHLDKILIHLSCIIRGNGQKKVQIGRIPPIYFDLLSRLSSHINRPELGALFAHTLLHYIANKRGSTLRRQRPEKVQTLLATLTGLSVHLEEPRDAINLLGPLFSQLDGRQFREPLTRLLSSLRRNERLPPIAREFLDILDSLESWDPRRIAEPDADRRCEALLLLHDQYEQRGEGAKMTANGAIQFLPLFAHSHAHSIMKSADLSLRGTAANCLRQLIAFVADPSIATVENFDPNRFLHSHLIPLTLRGLNSIAENGEESVRHEFMQCLVQLLHSFPQEPHLASLRAIGWTGTNNEEAEENEAISDTDFFQCAMHIQAHRRQRAFYRLAERLNTKNGDLDQIGHLPLLNYILPILTPYLMETSPNRSALADQTLNLFTAILKRCPWPKYQKLLEHHLHQMEKHEDRIKPAIRVIVALLDAFHFDLSKCKEGKLSANFAELKMEEQKKKEEKQNKEVEEIEGEIEDDDHHEEGEEEDAAAPEEMPNTISVNVLLEDTQNARIFAVVTRKLLPRIRNLLNPQRQLNNHKRAQQFTANSFQQDDEKLIRAPLAIAAVKLFKWLPAHVGQQNLHSYLSTLNQLLMSRSFSVRQGARKLMVQLVKLLGAKQLPFVMRELKQTMNKGYQVHVMVFTIHTLVNALEQQMCPGDLDPCLREIMEVCKWESFGNSQLEDEGDKKDKMLRSESFGVPEAKDGNRKTAETLTKIGRFVGSERALDEMVLGHMREISETNPTSETLRKLAEWLRALNVGMRFNAGGIPPLRQLQFALQMARTNLRQMTLDQSRNQLGNEKKRGGLRPQSCLLLAPEPKRLGVIQRVSLKSKVHIFVEFALQLLADQLRMHLVGGQMTKSEMVESTVEMEEEKMDGMTEQSEGEGQECCTRIEDMTELLGLFEQFVPILLDALKQKYDKIIALSLSSILFLLKYGQLKSLTDRQSELVERLFAILVDYAAMGQAGNRPAVIELQQNLFKCFTQVIRNAPLTKMLSGNQMQLLLNYVETDILDSHKQATAFNLIKAIIGRKIEDEKVTNMMEYLSETSITSFSANIRSQCRQVILLYLTIHLNGQRNYEQWMEFFLNQTEYELEDGRLSALEMIHSIICAFTEEANASYALLAYMKLASRLLNDQSERCRQFVSLCLRKLLGSITAAAFNDIHAATGDWLVARKPSIRLLAWRAFAQFVLSESSHFTSSLMKALIVKVCSTFSIDPAAFSSNLCNSTKLAICELLQTIAEKMPRELYEELTCIEENGNKKKKRVQASKVKKRDKKGAPKGDDENMHKKETTAKEEQQLKLRNFFANLEHCLLACRQSQQRMDAAPSDQINLSISASQFLVKWISHQYISDALIQQLATIHREKINDDINESIHSAPNSLNFSLCLSLISLLNPRNKKKRIENQAEDSRQEPVGMDEEGERKEGEIGEDDRWDDGLAELAIRLLAYFVPSTDNFEFCCRRLSKLCWTEAAKEPDKARKRLSILKLVGALALKLPVHSTQFGELCTRFLPLLYREMSKKSPKFTEELYLLASEVSDQFRHQMGNREFSARLAQCQKERVKDRQQRREAIKAQLIRDPAAAIAIKQKRHQRKRIAKLRRLDSIKPYRAFKRLRREEAMKRAASPEG